MITQALTLQALTFVACLVIFFKVEPVLNQMQGNCRVVVRLAFAFLAVGSAGVILMITQGYIPNPWLSLLIAGTALLLVSERRTRSLIQQNRPPSNERRVP